MKSFRRLKQNFVLYRALIAGLVSAVTFIAQPLAAEDGYELWLRYAPLPDRAQSGLAPL